MMLKKSPVSHTVLAHSKQHLHNKKRRPCREHQCGVGQIPSESQVRTYHNSKVLERGQLIVPWFVKVLVLLQQQRVDLFSFDQKSFPYRSPHERILRDPFLIGILLSSIKCGEQDIPLYTKSWIASKPVSRLPAYPIPQLQWCQLYAVSLLTASALKCASRTPFSAPIRSSFDDLYQWKRKVSLVAVSLCLTILSTIFILISINL